MKTALGSQLWLHAWDDDALIARQIDDMLACGLRIARVFLNWSAIEVNESERDYDLFDRFFALCEEKGMRVAPTLTCATGTPRWYEKKAGGEAAHA